MSSPGLPQSIIFEMPEGEISMIGIRCMHAYSSNPSKINVKISRDGSHFKVWTELNLNFSQGTQWFDLHQWISSEFKYIEIQILDTFGALRTYMNGIVFKQPTENQI